MLFRSAMTYQDMLNTVVFANQQFERLPSAIRAEFDNKPENLLAALHAKEKSPETAKKLQDLGLLEIPPLAPTESSQSAPQNAGDGKAPSPEGGNQAA